MEKHGSSCFVWSQLAPPPSGLFAFSPQLLETKSTDRKQTLLHYISNVVKEKYQHVSLFYNELHYVEKAAAGTVTLLCLVSGGGMRAMRGTSRHTVHGLWGPFSVGSCSSCGFRHLHSRSDAAFLFYFLVSLENVLLDVKELQRGLDLTKREYTMHDHNTMLKEFIQNNEGKLKKLQDDAKIAQVFLYSRGLARGYK